MKYRFILPLVLLGGILMAPSCQNKEQMKTDAADRVEETVVTSDTKEEMDQPDTTLSPDSLYMSYERTPCFGRCPIFKIRLYKSGYVTYEGINFVDNMGYYDAKATDKQVKLIRDQIAESGYADWENSYDNNMISDLPAQVYSVEVDGQQKRVVARYNVPAEVKELGLFIENVFKSTEWSAVTHDH